MVGLRWVAAGRQLLPGEACTDLRSAQRGAGNGVGAYPVVPGVSPERLGP